MTLPNEKATARVLATCKRDDANGCLVWPFAKTDSGHARGSVGGKTVRLNRVVLATKLGRELLSTEKARHTCDNCACLEPSHLVPGTQADNVRDMMERGRFRRRQRVLDKAKADELRRRREAGETVLELTAAAGVRKRQVERILSGRAHP